MQDIMILLKSLRILSLTLVQAGFYEQEVCELLLMADDLG